MKCLSLLLLLLISIGLFSQNLQITPLAIEDAGMDIYLKKKPEAVLTIKIKNAPDTIAEVDIKCTYVQFGSNFQTSRYYKFNKDGFAKITLDNSLPYQQIWLTIEHYLYAGLYLTNELNVAIDAEKIKNKDGFYMIANGVSYTGADGEFNSVMNKHVNFKQDTRNKLADELYELSLSRRKYEQGELLSKFNSVYEELHKIDNKFLLKFPNYRWAIENQLKAQYFSNLALAFWSDKMPDTIFTKVNSFAPYFVSNEGVGFYNYLYTYITTKKDNPKIVLDDELYKNYSSYTIEQRTVLDSIRYYSQIPGNEKDITVKKLFDKRKDLFLNEIEKIYVDHYLHLIDSLYTSPKSDILKTSMLAKSKNGFAQAYPAIMRTMQTSWCRDIAEKELIENTAKQKRIDSLLAKVSGITNSNLYVGDPLEHLSFDADLYKLDTINNIDNFIIDLRAKFPNKALIIDFWATWCSPCLKEFSFSKELHEKNKDLPIEFIYICTNSGSTPNLWKNKIAEFQLSGTHIFADDKFVVELKNKLNSKDSGFPAYVVIDIQGKLKPKIIESFRALDRNKLMHATGIK